jgi:hypothetical protein
MNPEQKANMARELLRGGLLPEVFSDIQSNIARAWANSVEIDERDDLWHLQKAIGMVEEVIEGYVSNYEYQQKVK